jgi:hypothetical protein
MKVDYNSLLLNGQQQINQVISHKTKALAIAAMENKFVRLFDINSGKVFCVISKLSHLSPTLTPSRVSQIQTMEDF